MRGPGVGRGVISSPSMHITDNVLGFDPFPASSVSLFFLPVPFAVASSFVRWTVSLIRSFASRLLYKSILDRDSN